MLLIAGIDPGVTGGAALYDFEADKLFAVYKLPNLKIKVGKHTRTRLDIDALEALLDCFLFMDVKFIGVENVQGGSFHGERKQGAAGAFAFGYTFGLIRMAAQMVGIPHDVASPAVWKAYEKVPKDEKGIVLKADKEFPEHKAMWHGPKGGALHDRAEAAFLARYFARRIWPAQQKRAGLRTMQAGIARKVAL